MSDDTTLDLAGRVLDVLIRHDIPLSEVTVSAGDMGDPWSGRILRHVLSLTVTVTPSIEVLGLDRSDLHRAMFLPVGERRWLGQMQALLIQRHKQRMAAMLLERARESVLKGADPDVVLAQLSEVA